MDIRQLTRFRLRSLLVLVSIAGLLLAWLHDHRHQVRKTQEATDATHNTIDASSRHFGSANVRAAIIDHAAIKAGITLSHDDVEREVKGISAKFGLEADRWYNMIEKERGLTPRDYRGQFIRPTLQLRGLQQRHPKVFERLNTAVKSQFPKLPPLPTNSAAVR